jgi:hypothetical protein
MLPLACAICVGWLTGRGLICLLVVISAAFPPPPMHLLILDGARDAQFPIECVAVVETYCRGYHLQLCSVTMIYKLVSLY